MLATTSQPLRLPFAHLNLRRNPFGELPLGERAELAVADVERFAARLPTPGYAVQFLGERGRGKTTHLLALRRYFPEAPYVYVPEDEPAPEVPAAAVVFLDELQRLPPRERRVLFRRRASFAIGSHADHARELERAGFTVETMVLRGLEPERLAAIVERRIEGARRGSGPVPRVPPDAVRALLARYGDDVRAIEHHLYERFQTLQEVGDAEV